MFMEKAKKIALWIFLASLPLSVHGQDCDSVVSDPAGALKGHQGEVESAAQDLIQKGADVRVWAVGNLGLSGNLDVAEKALERQCPSWEAGDGVSRKSTLLVLMVAPAEHKMGIYYGSAWNAALGEHWTRIKQQAMAPRFRDGDYAGGFIAAEQQLAKRIAASQDEALHPAQTVNQATDLSGLWHVLMWVVGIGAFGFAVVFIAASRGKRRERQEALRYAQQRAIIARTALADLLNRLRSKELDANHQAAVDDVSVSYSELAGRAIGDPNQEGLSQAEYEAMELAYTSLHHQLEKRLAPEETFKPAPKAKTTKAANVPPPTPAPAAPVHHHHTTVVQSGGSSDLGLGVILGEEMASRRESERESKRESFSSDWGSSSSGSSSDSGGGGSSDFGSSFGGGGGSSDFGGGGSDSGGGGGSSSF